MSAHMSSLALGALLLLGVSTVSGMPERYFYIMSWTKDCLSLVNGDEISYTSLRDKMSGQGRVVHDLPPVEPSLCSFTSFLLNVTF
jgi:hypothetical protein